MRHTQAVMEQLIQSEGWKMVVERLKRDIDTLDKYILEGRPENQDAYLRAVDRRKMLLHMYEVPLLVAGSDVPMTELPSLDPYFTAEEL